jgi:hypothetical protein
MPMTNKRAFVLLGSAIVIGYIILTTLTSVEETKNADCARLLAAAEQAVSSAETHSLENLQMYRTQGAMLAKNAIAALDKAQQAIDALATGGDGKCLQRRSGLDANGRPIMSKDAGLSVQEDLNVAGFDKANAFVDKWLESPIFSPEDKNKLKASKLRIP